MAKLLIDGQEYEIVTLDTLTVGENRIVKRYTGVAGQALEELDDNDPDLTAAMIHIAFVRENPALSFAAAERRVDAVKYSEIDFTPDPDDEEQAPLATPSDEPPTSADDTSPPSTGPLSVVDSESQDEPGISTGVH